MVLKNDITNQCCQVTQEPQCWPDRPQIFTVKNSAALQWSATCQRSLNKWHSNCITENARYHQLQKTSKEMIRIERPELKYYLGMNYKSVDNDIQESGVGQSKDIIR